MPVRIVMEFPGVSAEQYDRAIESLGNAPIEGLLFHTCGPVEGGWTTVDIWESNDAAHAYMGKWIGALQAHGFPRPSKREVHQVHHVQDGQAGSSKTFPE